MADLKRLAGAVDGLAGIAAHRDPTKPAAEHIQKVARASEKLGVNLPAITERVNKHITKSRADFEAAFVQNSGLKQTDIAGELRALVRTMDPGARVNFVQKLIVARDTSGLGAILLAPAYLSGLDPKYIERSRAQFFEIAVPDAWKAKQDFEYITEHVETALKVASQAVTDFGSPEKLKAIEAEQAAAEAAQGSLAANLGGDK